MTKNGGEWVAEVLAAQGVAFVFTLTGGHIAPILVSCKRKGIRVVDVRHEVNAVFAADAVARLTGVPGVAVVTAGPGVTNTLTAVKNAQMAQSPVVLIGGSAPTALKGRGALQDINQLALFRSVVKWSRAVKRVKDIVPALELAFLEAQKGAPGPVFVELPVDLLYDETVVREGYPLQGQRRSLAGKVVSRYLKYHVNRLFAGVNKVQIGPRIRPEPVKPDGKKVEKVARKLATAKRPVLVVGSQALLDVESVDDVAAAIEELGIPVYLSGMARGLLGVDHSLQMRHKRRNAIKEADMIILAGVPCDFRLDYGNHIRRSALYVSANRSTKDLKQNRRPNIGMLADPGRFLRDLAEQFQGKDRWPEWQATLRERNEARNEEIQQQALAATGKINPLHLFQEMGSVLTSKSILVADGGDFVGTASYILNPLGPLTWLDPGPFGTLGVGAGFALGAKLARPEADVWIIYGDGAAGFSLVEWDSFVRHKVPVIAVVGNDAGWTQIAREQVPMLGDDVATGLAYTDYDRVAIGFGGAGIKIEDPELIQEVLGEVQEAHGEGRAVLLNAIIGKTDFRKGSISL